MERGDGVIEGLEDVLGPDGVQDSESLELGHQRLGGGDAEHDVALGELSGKFEQRLAPGEVDVVDCIGHQNEPPRRLGAVDERQDVVIEPCRVGIEETDTEPEHDEPGCGSSLGGGGDLGWPSLLVLRDDRVRRVVVAPDVIEQGQDDGEEDPLLNATTTTVVADAMTYSSRRRRRISFMAPILTSLTPMRKTTAESTAFGMYCSGLVRNSRTIPTVIAIVSIATCVLLCASSAISVLVGLPLTGNVPLNPAATLATLSPTRSLFSTKCSWYLMA